MADERKKKKNVMLETMTGEEFKTLIEQFTQDGRIDTIPELIRVLSDIPEDQTLGQYIEEHGGQVDPKVVRDAVDEALDENAREAYDEEYRRLYLFGRPKEEADIDVNAEDGEDDI